MQLYEAIALIRSDSYTFTEPSQWADLGCGSGLFTRALATLQPTGSVIYAVDMNQAVLSEITDYEGVTIKTVCQDFIQDEWPFAAIDGLLMANSLHYVKDKMSFFEKAHRYLTDSGCFLLIEYDTDTANPWVPYPLSYDSLQPLAKKAGYTSVKRIHTMASLYRRAAIYSALITK